MHVCVSVSVSACMYVIQLMVNNNPISGIIPISQNGLFPVLSIHMYLLTDIIMCLTKILFP